MHLTDLIYSVSLVASSPREETQIDIDLVWSNRLIFSPFNEHEKCKNSIAPLGVKFTRNIFCKF